MVIMVRPMNFNTSNSTFRQFIGSGQSYRVPRFQREYFWGEDEWDDLWQDISALFGDEPAHYMGYLVLQSTDNRAFEIIDGQQRITTLSLLMLAAVAHLRDLAGSDSPLDPENRRAEQLRSSYIGFLDPVSLVSRSKLELGRHNDRFYQDFLVPLEPLPIRGLNASERLLRQAFLWFKECLSKHAGNDGESVASFIDCVVDRLFFTVITVTDELNAFKVFESLNARGVRLSATDLLKNFLFSVVAREGAHESEVKTLEARWESIVDLLGNESLPEYLRVYWNSRNPLTRKTALFKTIRSAIRNRADAFELIRNMDRCARVYAALQSPADREWSPEERDGLTQLRLFNVRQPFAVLLAAFDRLGEQDRAEFGRFLKAICVVSFRYNVICRRQANEQEALYNRIACGIMNGDIGNISGAIQALHPIYPEDREFRAAFADKTLKTQRHRRVIRYILLRLERSLSGQEYDFESATFNIEHVLPENPEQGWDQFDDRQREEFTYRLGNQTLLATSANRDLEHSPYERKREVFQQSEFEITRKLAEQFDAWTAEKLQAHQNWMAKQATNAWKISFSR